jgi:hypothetical protein
MFTEVRFPLKPSARDSKAQKGITSRSRRPIIVMGMMLGLVATSGGFIVPQSDHHAYGPTDTRPTVTNTVDQSIMINSDYRFKTLSLIPYYLN